MNVRFFVAYQSTRQCLSNVKSDQGTGTATKIIRSTNETSGCDGL
jgi:hypothetical protein